MIVQLSYAHTNFFFFFFFQAEDGIRDYKVTGVQTCALPICRDEGERALRADEQVQLRRGVGEAIKRVPRGALASAWEARAHELARRVVQMPARGALDPPLHAPRRSVDLEDLHGLDPVPHAAAAH